MPPYTVCYGFGTSLASLHTAAHAWREVRKFRLARIAQTTRSAGTGAAIHLGSLPNEILCMVEQEITTMVCLELEEDERCECPMSDRERRGREVIMEQSFNAWLERQAEKSTPALRPEQRRSWASSSDCAKAVETYNRNRHRTCGMCRAMRSERWDRILWELPFPSTQNEVHTDLTGCTTMLSDHGLLFVPPRLSSHLTYTNAVDLMHFVVGLADSVEELEAKDVVEAAAICNRRCSASASRRHIIKSLMTAMELGDPGVAPQLHWWIVRQDGASRRSREVEELEDYTDSETGDDSETDTDTEAEDVSDGYASTDSEAVCAGREADNTVKEEEEETSDEWQRRLSEWEKDLKKREEKLKEREEVLLKEQEGRLAIGSSGKNRQEANVVSA